MNPTSKAQVQNKLQEEMVKAAERADTKTLEKLSRCANRYPIAFGTKEGDPKLVEKFREWSAFEDHLRARMLADLPENGEASAQLIDGFYDLTARPYGRAWTGHKYSTVSETFGGMVREVEQADSKAEKHSFWQCSTANTQVLEAYAEFRGFRLERGCRLDSWPGSNEYFLVKQT